MIWSNISGFKVFKFLGYRFFYSCVLLTAVTILWLEKLGSWKNSKNMVFLVPVEKDS